MMTTDTAGQWWAWLRAHALAQPNRTIQVSKYDVPHPRNAGAYVSVGLPIGQDEDLRFPPEHDCRGVHVQSFGAVWLIHVDVAHPTCGPLEHLRHDAPATWTAALTTTGSLLGLLIGRRKEAAVAGALIGAAVGVIGVALARADQHDLLDSTDV